MLAVLAALLSSAVSALATSPEHEMDRVRQLLLQLNLVRYAGAFEAAGYDDADFLLRLSASSAQQVAQAVGMSPGHAHKFVHSVEKGRAHMFVHDLAAAAGASRPAPAASAVSTGAQAMAGRPAAAADALAPTSTGWCVKTSGWCG